MMDCQDLMPVNHKGHHIRPKPSATDHQQKIYIFIGHEIIHFFMFEVV